MVIEELDPAAALEWDAYVSGKEGANCYHLHAWRTAGERGYGLRAPYLAARAQPRGEIRGVLPLFFVRSPPWRGYATTGLFGSYGRVLADDPSIAALLLREARRRARDAGLGSLRFKGLGPEPAAAGFLAAVAAGVGGRSRAAGLRQVPGMSEAVVAPERPRWLLRVAAWAIAAAVAVVAARSVDLPALGAALRRGRWEWVALAVVCGLVANTLARTRRWQALLEPIPHRQRASFVDLVRISYASGAISNLLPARAGEAVKVVELKRRRGYPAGALIAAQLAEKGIEALSLGLVFGIFALLPGAHPAPLAIAGAAAASGVVLLAVLPRRAPGVAGKFVQALRAVHAERSWVRSLLWSIFSDLVDLLLVALCLRALGIAVHPAVWAMVLLSVNFALLLPSTPGNIGVLEAGAVVALVAAGVPAEAALAFALVYHAIQLLPGTLLGALAIWLPWR